MLLELFNFLIFSLVVALVFLVVPYRLGWRFFLRVFCVFLGLGILVIAADGIAGTGLRASGNGHAGELEWLEGDVVPEGKVDSLDVLGSEERKVGVNGDRFVVKAGFGEVW
ncbi:hypothetical protein, partial [Pararcticibacter amylolyticus]